MKIRHAAAVATLAIVAGVFAFQAITARPPEPAVEIAGMPPAPVIRTRCENGEFVRVYTDHNGIEYEPMPTGVIC